MNHIEYDRARIARQGKPWSDPMHEVLSNALGLCGESAELSDAAHVWASIGCSKSRVVEECGDVVWYVAAAAQAHGWELHTIVESTLDFRDARPALLPLTESTRRLLSTACRYAEQVKKAAFHAHAMNDAEVITALACALDSAHHIAVRARFTLGEAMAANHSKLEARWPGGFKAHEQGKR